MRLKTKFQDKNFELGEVVNARITTYSAENKVVVWADIARGDITRFEYNSIKEFTDHWEDVPEEPKKHYFISNNGQIHEEGGHDRYRKERQEIGNDFETEEEADKAAEKLKAFTRLKDKGFSFEGIKEGVMGHELKIYARFTKLRRDEIDTAFFDNQKDLELLFGGEE